MKLITFRSIFPEITATVLFMSEKSVRQKKVEDLLKELLEELKAISTKIGSSQEKLQQAIRRTKAKESTIDSESKKELIK